jgi:hypothetical protein
MEVGGTAVERLEQDLQYVEQWVRDPDQTSHEAYLT